jgi:hypothetical protein
MRYISHQGRILSIVLEESFSGWLMMVMHQFFSRSNKLNQSLLALIFSINSCFLHVPVAISYPPNPPPATNLWFLLLGGMNKKWSVTFRDDSFAAIGAMDFHSSITQMLCRCPQIVSISFSGTLVEAHY